MHTFLTLWLAYLRLCSFTFYTQQWNFPHFGYPTNQILKYEIRSSIRSRISQEMYSEGLLLSFGLSILSTKLCDYEKNDWQFRDTLYVTFYFSKPRLVFDVSRNNARTWRVLQRRGWLFPDCSSRQSFRLNFPYLKWDTEFCSRSQLITEHARMKRKFPVSFVLPLPGRIIGRIFIDTLDRVEIMTRAISSNSSLSRRLITAMYGTVSGILWRYSRDAKQYTGWSWHLVKLNRNYSAIRSLTLRTISGSVFVSGHFHDEK